MRERVVVATIDGAAAEVVREALADLDVPARFVPVRATDPLSYLRHQRYPRLDVEVDADRADEARALIDRLQLDAEAAAVAEAERADPTLADGDDPAVLRREPASPLKALALALVVPVAGPIYVGAMWLVLVSIAAHLCAFLALVAGPDAGQPARAWLPFLVPLVAARVFDVIASPIVAAVRADEANAPRPTPTN